MPINALHHVTVKTDDLDATRDFYQEILGLEVGFRPDLDFPGYWLYSGGVATVHLLGERKPREGIVVRGTEKKFEDTGRFDHIAFAASDLPGVRKRLQSKSVTFPRAGLVNVYCDIHSDMAAFVIVTPNRAAAQPRPDGTWSLPDLPSGHYVLHVWHPDFGTFDREVDLAGDRTLALTY